MMPRRSPISPLLLSGLLALSQVGCVALNIPSRRYHDPEDRGGLFGSWRQEEPGSALEAGHDGGETVACGASTRGCEDDWDAFDSGCGMQTAEKPPEIPWPRYHPVPTRPVFGPKWSEPPASAEPLSTAAWTTSAY